MMLISTKQERIEELKDGSKEQIEGTRSYSSNNDTEITCIKYLQNFELLYTQSGWDGTLLLYTKNEYGIEKPLCTILRPTMLSDSDLFDLETMSAFVTLHVTLEQLEDPMRPPKTISSPTSVMQWKLGDSFESAFLLASLLIGMHYDAYVVFGCAPVWLCNNDLKACHLPIANDRSLKTLKKTDFIESSNFLFKPSSTGNVHCWVLVRGGSRGLEEMLFLEPPSGHAFSPEDSPYDKIFSVCNNKNIWIHKPITTINGVTFDLVNEDIWQPVFRDDVTTSDILSTADVAVPPISWAHPISIDNNTKSEIGTKRINLYHKTQQELFSKTGCIGYENHAPILKERRTHFTCEKLVEVDVIYEWFQPTNRSFLEKRKRWPMKRIYHEQFIRGHKSALEETTKQLGYYHEMTFFLGSRLDGLIHWKDVFETSIECQFEGRSDCLESLYFTICVDEHTIKSSKFVTISSSQVEQQIAIKSITQTFRNDQSSLQNHPYRYRSLIEEQKIMIEHFPADERSIPVTETLSRSDTSNCKAAYESEKKCIALIRSLYAEMMSMISSHEDAMCFIDKQKDINTGAINDQISNKTIAMDTKDDWLAPFIKTHQIFHTTEELFTQELAMELKNECLRAMQDRLDERKALLQIQIEKEQEIISTLTLSDNKPHDHHFRLKLLEKRLRSQKELNDSKIQELKENIKRDRRFESLLQ